ncbi:hypothetical protein D6D25_08820 [Aureobasidium pullulans]|nr:hypothetical protein D6D25_08820 [Aureobasidium pullulans]
MTTKLFTVEQCIEENIQLSAGYRDFEGYKGQTPDPQWPGQAKICVSIVLNYEEGGEYSVLNGDLRSETDLQEIMGRPIRPGARDIQMETQYEYGTRAGVWRIGRFFEERKVKVTVHAVGQSILKSPDAAKYLAGCGHEFSSHAYRWIDYLSMPLAVEEEQINKCVDAIKEISGHPPKGWYVGRPSISSKGLVCHAFKQRGLELLYQSDSYGDDLPYWTAHPTEADKGLLMLPYTYDVNDNKFCTSPGFVNPTVCLSSFSTESAASSVDRSPTGMAGILQVSFRCPT